MTPHLCAAAFQSCAAALRMVATSENSDSARVKAAKKSKSECSQLESVVSLMPA
jgi:hypothetical protein